MQIALGINRDPHGKIHAVDLFAFCITVKKEVCISSNAAITVHILSCHKVPASPPHVLACFFLRGGDMV